jgi:predicted ATPase/transcriptional regulator with XRE-family HTH domain
MAERQTSFPRLLRRFRLAAELSQEELAARAGLSARAVSDLERGLRASPRPETVRMLAEALRLDAADRAALTAAAHPELAEEFASSVAASPQASSRDLQPSPLALPPLPIPPTRLVGREAEVARLCALLRREEVRLVTLTGPGGVGKTRLALAVAEELAGEERCADGVAFVELAPLRDPDLVASTMAAAMGVREDGGPSLETALKGALRERRLLMVLDNLEHLLPAAPLVAELLAACSGLAVLATSRERLRLRGERVVPVVPLALPEAPDPRRPPPLEGLAGVAAVRLFAERAEEANPDFALTADAAPAVAELVRRLDGLPLAVELAAAWAAVLSPAAMLARLGRRLPLLTGGSRDLPARLRTMRDAIAWSHDLLAREEQVLFRRLAIFAGGFTLEATEHVGGRRALLSVPDAVASLADKSLLRVETPIGDEPRFSMLATIREFGLEQLVASGEEHDIRAAHAAHFISLAERARPHLYGPAPVQSEWLNRLGAAYPDLRDAMSWTIEQGQAVTAVRLATLLHPFWVTRGYVSEERDWLDRALRVPFTGDAGLALRAEAIRHRGTVALRQGDLEAAEGWLEQGIALHRRFGDSAGIARNLFVLAAVAEDRGDDIRAGALYEQAAPLFAAQGAVVQLAETLESLADIDFRSGDLERAARLAAEALAKGREGGDAAAIVQLLVGAAQVAIEQGRLAEARDWLREGAEQARQIDYPEGIIDVLVGYARLAGLSADASLAARLLGAVDALRRTIGVTRITHHELGRRALATARAALADREFEDAWAAGRLLSPAEALAQASVLDSLPFPTLPPQTSPSSAPVSP